MGPRRLFVTGGTGYIGGVLIELAVADGYKVSSTLFHLPTGRYLYSVESRDPVSCG